MPDATQWSGVARPVQSPTAMRFGPSTWATASIESPSRMPEAGRLVGQPGQPLELGQRDPAQVERPLGPLGQADDDQPEAVLAGLVVLLDEAALLERGEQPRRGRLVQPEPAGELGHAGLALALAEGEQERRRPIDRADRVAVEDHAARPVQPAAGATSRRAGVGADGSPWARASSAASSESEKIETTRSTMSPCGVRLAHEPRLARVRLGHRAAGVHPDRDRVVQLVVGGRPVAVLASPRCSVNMIPNMHGWPVKWYGRPVGSRTSRRPAWTRRPVAWIVSSAFGVA